MTATTSRVTTNDSFLRFALRLDAVCTGLGGVALAAAAGPMSSFTEVPRAAEYGLAAFFVVYGITVFGLSRLPAVRTPGVWVIVANLLFTVAAVAVVLAGVWPLTTAGIVFVLAGGVYTLVMADLQYLGLRRMRP
ncbi:hypothetical protein [Mycolicibacterium sp. YH-1]|uniref:hypothetical protein n=1 Tax=Mycolicibacterium sp. YH-1 TaxID=2908837 RepID=UPI001F4C45DF|nr:hypothetical protein [Mycolicibacterium sp. YH-1]UNB54147.1 hypothetical protein L0M16_07375 [Mycolicibacterium sp. YH-1]